MCNKISHSVSLTLVSLPKASSRNSSSLLGCLEFNVKGVLAWGDISKIEGCFFQRNGNQEAFSTNVSSEGNKVTCDTGTTLLHFDEISPEKANSA